MLEVSGLRKAFPDGSRKLAVLDDVSFTLAAGDFAALYGKRRSGKSTLLRIVAGLDVPDRGSVRIDGNELTSLPADQRARFLRDRVAMTCFFFGGPDRNRLVREHVAMAQRVDGRTTGRRASRQAREVLRDVGVQECYEAPLRRLSLGERIRVELARALIRRPRLLLVDDPPPLHSPSEGNDLYELLLSLGSNAERTVLLASSDFDLAQRAPRLLRLSAGDLRAMDREATVVPFPMPKTGTDQA
ncbi:MAG TPA: ATP-binding cassette domain-containing protein [Solirubrobacteraceae bacterium]|nr:ATP-binding cassette domain-containing protein [Solirubrobacteraceae bacterium]